MMRSFSSLGTSLLAGFVGAVTVTVLHESARRLMPGAPRMDLAGMRALRRLLEGAGLSAPRGRRLRRAALLGDLASNSAAYALAAGGRGSFLRAGGVGLAYGLGALLLPPRLGLGRRVVGRGARGKATTVALYLSGGLAAALAARAMRPAFEARLRPERP